MYLDEDDYYHEEDCVIPHAEDILEPDDDGYDHEEEAANAASDWENSREQ